MNLSNLAVKYEVNEQDLKEAIDKLKNKECLLFTMSGKMGSGKDTVGDIISDELNSKDYKLINTSFGYLIRKELTDVVKGYQETTNMYDYAVEVNAEKQDLDLVSHLLKDCTAYDRTDEARTALQVWGTEVRRKQKNNYWINQMVKFIVEAVNKGHSVNVTDARFPNEVELVEDLLGKVIRLDVPAKERLKRIQKRDQIKVTYENFNHVSEFALDKYEFERIFDGMKKPQEIADEALEYILK